MKMQTTVRVIFVLCVTIIIGLVPFSFSHAATAKEINVSVDVALARFTKEVKGAKEFLHAAKGVLVIPRVVQAGLSSAVSMARVP